MSPRARGLGSVFLAVAFVATARALDPHAETRALLSYAIVVCVGWGHLVGGAWFSWRRVASSLPGTSGGPAFGLLATSSLIAGLSVYGSLLEWGRPWLVASADLVFYGLFVVSAWHVVENEHAMACAARRGGSLPPLRAAPARTVVAALAALLALTAVLASARPLGLTFADAYAAVTVFHLASWCLHFAGRGGRAWGRIAIAHLPGIALGAWLWRAGPAWDATRTLYFSPLVYGFFSTLHVVQTAWVRSLGRNEGGGAADRPRAATACTPRAAGAGRGGPRCDA